MKVKELIKELQKYDDEFEIKYPTVYNDYGEGSKEEVEYVDLMDLPNEKYILLS